MDAAPGQVVNNEAKHRFELEVDGFVAVVDYRLEDHTITLVHTEVPEQIAGQGIAGTMAKAALEYAKRENLSVIPLCPYIDGYIKRHPDYQSLVAH